MRSARYLTWVGLLVCALALGACGGGEPGLTVFAAASLRDVCVELGRDFEAQGGASVQFHFAGSNLLARQIVAARAADAFLSADGHQVDVVERAGILSAGTRRALLTNRLVVVVPEDSSWSPEHARDLTQVTRLSLADPEFVPAGRYAREWLEQSGHWDALRGRVLPAVDVRAALAAVEVGAAEAGVCYATDAARSRAVRVAFEVPPSEAPAISYVACALDDSIAGASFVDYLTTPAASAVFERHGFIVLRGGTR